MASVTPIMASQDTPQTTSSTSYTDASCETAALANSVDYLVLYCAAHGANNTSRRSWVQLDFGGTQIAESEQEGYSVTDVAGVLPIHGVRKVTGDGSSTLKFQHKGNTGSGTFAVGAMWICAIPMTDFGTAGTDSTEGDYYGAGTTSATDEVTDASTSGWTTLRSLTVEAAASAEDYLILAACEGTPQGSGTTQCRARLNIDGTPLGRSYSIEGSTGGTYQFSFGWATIASLSGNVDIDIEVQSGVSADSDYRRSNVWVVRKLHWDQMVATVDTTDRSMSSATYTDVAGLTTTYTPNQTEYVVSLASIEGRTNTVGAALVLQILNETTAVAHRVDSGGPPQDGNLDSLPVMLGLCEQRSAATDYTVQYARKTNLSGTRTAYVHQPSEMIQWGLTTAGAAPAFEPNLFMWGSFP